MVLFSTAYGGVFVIFFILWGWLIDKKPLIALILLAESFARRV